MCAAAWDTSISCVFKSLIGCSREATEKTTNTLLQREYVEALVLAPSTKATVNSLQCELIVLQTIVLQTVVLLFSAELSYGRPLAQNQPGGCIRMDLPFFCLMAWIPCYEFEEYETP